MNCRVPAVSLTINGWLEVETECYYPQWHSQGRIKKKLTSPEEKISKSETRNIICTEHACLSYYIKYKKSPAEHHRLKMTIQRARPFSSVRDCSHPAGARVPNNMKSGRGLGMRNTEQKSNSWDQWSSISWWLMPSKFIKKYSIFYIIFRGHGDSQGQQRTMSDNVSKENMGYIRHSCFRTNNYIPGGKNWVPKSCNLNSSEEALTPALGQSCQD